MSPVSWIVAFVCGAYGFAAFQEATSDRVPYPDWLRPYELAGGTVLMVVSVVALAWRGGDE